MPTWAVGGAGAEIEVSPPAVVPVAPIEVQEPKTESANLASIAAVAAAVAASLQAEVIFSTGPLTSLPPPSEQETQTAAAEVHSSLDSSLGGVHGDLD
jgi:hypothetical protein